MFRQATCNDVKHVPTGLIEMLNVVYGNEERRAFRHRLQHAVQGLRHPEANRLAGGLIGTREPGVFRSERRRDSARLRQPVWVGSAERRIFAQLADEIGEGGKRYRLAYFLAPDDENEMATRRNRGRKTPHESGLPDSGYPAHEARMKRSGLCLLPHRLQPAEFLRSPNKELGSVSRFFLARGRLRVRRRMCAGFDSLDETADVGVVAFIPSLLSPSEEISQQQTCSSHVAVQQETFGERLSGHLVDGIYAVQPCCEVVDQFRFTTAPSLAKGTQQSCTSRSEYPLSSGIHPVGEVGAGAILKVLQWVP